MVRNRAATDAEKGGGYTDLEVLEVINPGKAARIRLRQARYLFGELFVTSTGGRSVT